MNQRIETARLLLREVKESDALPLFYQINHNPNVLKTFLTSYMDDPSEASVDSLLQFQDKGNLIYILELKQTHEVIGLLLEQGHTAETIELGYAIGESFWNQGYTTEAMKAVLQHLFQQDFKTVTAQCFVENIASEKVMIKCGMKRTSTSYELMWQNQSHLVIEYQIHQPTGL